MNVFSGINPNIHSDKHINDTIASIFNFFSEKSKISQIQYYGAGCGSETNISRVFTILKNYFFDSEIHIYSDLMASAHALTKGNTGIVAILGTGSNAAFFDGTNLIKMTPSLGYLLGDEGSATDIGKTFLRNLLYREVPDDLAEEFLNHSTIAREMLINYIYSLPQPNKFFADTGAFITSKNQHYFAENLIFKCFSEFIKQLLLPLSVKYEITEMNFTGSMAFLNRHILRRALHLFNLSLKDVLQNPLEGLWQFYQAEK